MTAGHMISQLANLSSELSKKSLLSFERPDTVRSNSSTTFKNLLKKDLQRLFPQLMIYFICTFTPEGRFDMT